VHLTVVIGVRFTNLHCLLEWREDYGDVQRKQCEEIPIEIKFFLCVYLAVGLYYWYCHVYEWLWTGFGFVIGFIEHLNLVAASNSSAVPNSQTMQFTTACIKSSQFAVSSAMTSASVLTFTTNFLPFWLQSKLPRLSTTMLLITVTTRWIDSVGSHWNYRLKLFFLYCVCMLPSLASYSCIFMKLLPSNGCLFACFANAAQERVYMSKYNFFKQNCFRMAFKRHCLLSGTGAATFLSSSSSVVLTRLSGPHSIPTTSQKIW
jgi:hypothetical protein